MEKPKRIVDTDGYIINDPEHFHETLRWGRHMIDKMEEEKVDRSDMHLMVQRLTEELRFTLTMLRNRNV
jgi:hypothetical protein